jgi:GT2 family glycosyltransferase/protoporphyrinogen oxidase
MEWDLMKVGILGAGISGLSCAWLLKQQGIESKIFEGRDYVGGLARSFKWNGFDCDFSTHRLFTLDENVLRQLLALVPMGRHIRRSQIYLGGKWLHDPINITEVLYRFNPWLTGQLVLGYLTRPRNLEQDSFNDYVIQRYGRGLNDFIFRPYTERLFGLSGDEISVEWAKQKIRLSGPLDILRESSKKKFSYFYYPVRGGYGAIAQTLYKEVESQVRLNCMVKSLEFREGQIVAVHSEQQGKSCRDEFDLVISTLPLTVLGRMLGQQFTLGFRPVDAVYLHVNQPYVSDNHWVYFMDSRSTINRMVEFKNMSPVEQPPDSSVLCAEITKESPNPVEDVIRDVVESRLLPRAAIVDTMVKREPFGYPVYTREYQNTVTRARDYLGQFNNLFLVGRSAEFEHKEVDDNFTTAIEVVREIVRRWQPASLRIKKEETMPVQSENPSVYVVILTFNNIEDTLECLKSVGEQTYKNLRVLVVDNGSKDNTPARIRENFPDVQIVESGQNLGVPWGYNIGFSIALEAGAQYVFMLNNDTVLAADLIQKLVDAAEADDTTGLVMPKILYYDEPNIIWAAGGKTRFFPPSIIIVGAGKDERKFSGAPEYLEFALSCGLLIHRRAFEKAGLFDPGYFYWFDDWDFSERVRALGLKIRYVPEARMWHKVSRTIRASGNRTSFYQVWGESAARYYRRHGRPPFITLPLHIGYIMAREVVKGNARYLKHFVIGLRAGLTKPLGRLPSVSDVPSYIARVQARNE